LIVVVLPVTYQMTTVQRLSNIPRNSGDLRTLPIYSKMYRLLTNKTKNASKTTSHFSRKYDCAVLFNENIAYNSRSKKCSKLITTSTATQHGNLASDPPFKKIMVANRGEIAVRIMRAGNELGARMVGIYSFEDRQTAHRYKADESYMVGEGLSPVASYLNIDEIVNVAKQAGVEAIHPGYGFLSERTEFAATCEKNGIKFIGPTVQNLSEFGDKTSARQLALASNVPVVPGTDNAVSTVTEALKFVQEHGCPIIIKAAMGGGGKGMRVVLTEAELQENFKLAQSEALAAFGDGTVFLERYVADPRHIEVQIIGDGKGNVVHLYDRDCSLQRRHQKVIETAPALGLDPDVRQAILEDAVRLTSNAKYRNAGTVEFLVDKKGNHYFIEVNPRIQVEHTVTEEVTGIDLVQTQMKIASGKSFEELGLKQEDIRATGVAMQCRVTTEDPSRNFTPDSGHVSVFRQPTGMGIRLDDGPGFVGANITPFYDSLLVKLTGRAGTREECAAKLRRALSEFRIRGVTTNIYYLRNVLSNAEFVNGNITTSFIGKNPDLLMKKNKNEKFFRNRAQRLLTFLAEIIVNGSPAQLGADAAISPSEIVPIVPKISEIKGLNLQKSKNSLFSIYKKDGPAAFAKAVREHKGLLVTDTTWRDAHQSLLATRVRTHDILKIAPASSIAFQNAYSIENWGGATFDVAMRFLNECPWDRLGKMREAVPDVPFQMLLRGANTVGYTSYPDNVVYKFCDLAVKHGMDVFRIFDSLNYIENMRLGIDAVGEAGGVIEASICYTGDVSRDEAGYKYTIDYYLELARQLVAQGIHVLAIKDMAGLLKPRAATMLITALRQEFPEVPIHVHTHDTAGAGVASMIAAAEAGADAVDLAIDSMSGLTSQPSMGAVVAALEGTDLDTGINMHDLTLINEYWEQTRQVYAPFESGQKSGSADVYDHEMPGGQYTNLLFQSSQLGLAGRWPQVKRKYAEANDVLGDIVKVTPSSKVVGDLAQFMVTNNLSKEDVETNVENLSLPLSVVEFCQGYLGVPHGGFPEPFRSHVIKGKVLKNGKESFDGRPGEELPAYDFIGNKEVLNEKFNEELSETDMMSHILYPQVFEDFKKFAHQHGNVSVLDTRTFVHGLALNEEAKFDIEDGKTLYVTLKSVGSLDLETGTRDVYFDLNGHQRIISIEDKNAAVESVKKERAIDSVLGSVGAPMPGVVVNLRVAEGEYVAKGDPLVVLSAMKMETVVAAPCCGKVKRVVVNVGDNLSPGDLTVEIGE
jgi:pyruvate carboxylase